MHKLLFAASFLVLGPLSAWGGDNSCLNQARLKTLQERPDIPIAIANAMSASVDEVAALPRERESYSIVKGELDAPSYVVIKYLFELHKNGSVAYFEYTLSPPDDESTDNVLTVSQDVNVVTDAGIPIYSTKIRAAYKADCVPKQIIRVSIPYIAQSDGKFKVMRTSTKTGHTPELTSKIVDREAILSAAYMDRQTYLSSMRNSPYFGRSFSALDDGKDLPVVLVNLSEAPKIKRVNSFTHNMEVLKGVALRLLNVDYEKRYYSSTSSEYRLFTTLVSGKVISQEEAVPRQVWLSKSFSNKMIISNIKLVGFKKGDFDYPLLRYSIVGTGRLPQFFNLNSYVKISRLNQKQATGWSFEAKVEEAHWRPQTIAWNAPVSEADQKYLQGSRYIQLDKVHDLVEQLRGELVQSDRLQAGLLIIQLLTKTISYDFEAVSAGLVDERTTEDILQTKKGVCQHYAVVFTAIARALGIPTRIVEGYYLNATGPNGPEAHAWVEIKIDDKTWWPLEPQIVAESLQSRAYLPINEMRQYEAEANTFDGQLQTTFKDIKIWEPWESATITKRK